jgi:regulator of replication initiation timing
VSTTSTPPATEDTARRRHGVLKAVTEHWLPFLTAILVLATAVVGLYAKQATSERDDLEDTSAALETQITDLSARNEELADSNEQLQAENEALRERLDGFSDSTTSTTPARPSATPEVFRDSSGTPVVVPAYDGIDLDSQESNWGIESSSRDLYVLSGARSVDVTDILTIIDSPPTVDECEAQTVRQSRLEAAQTVVGQQMCVRSGEGRWAYVRIAAIDTEAETISFDITVWKLTSDP